MAALSVGLTGGIASGKSLAASRFEALGVPLIDADIVSREVVQPGMPALLDIAREFGPDFLTAAGELDRRRMREHVFTYPDARKALEAIVHPHMFARIRGWLAAQPAPYCILSAAILIESGMHTLVQRVLVIDVDPAVQLARLRGRDGIDGSLAQAMIAAQATRDARLAVADDVLLNQGPVEALALEVDRLHQRYLGLAAAAR